MPETKESQVLDIRGRGRGTGQGMGALPGAPGQKSGFPISIVRGMDSNAERSHRSSARILLHPHNLGGCQGAHDSPIAHRGN